MAWVFNRAESIGNLTRNSKVGKSKQVLSLSTMVDWY